MQLALGLHMPELNRKWLVPGTMHLLLAGFMPKLIPLRGFILKKLAYFMPGTVERQVKVFLHSGK